MNFLKKKTVVVGMSGGVDSAVTAAILKEEGYNVMGVTLTLWQDEREDEKRWQDRSCCKVGLARHVARVLEIPHHSVDVQKVFQAEVIDNFAAVYLMGETPNPCVRCNERIKFGKLLSVAKELGADFLATGHYARIQFQPDRKRYALYKGVDPKKDQSYFLYRLSQEQLGATLFPLGAMNKEAVYQRAVALGLPYEEVLESQEVCFVTQKDYRAFLSENHPESMSPGNIVTETGETVGEHDGIAFYTIGQRRGVGVALGERHYVTGLNLLKNEVTVGPESSLFVEKLITKDHVWGGLGIPEEPICISAKLRYRASEQKAELSILPDQYASLCFERPQRAVAAGQSAVFYKEDEVIGGGVIVSLAQE